MNLPLFMVSMKCVRQPSSASTLPRAVAMPPSAMTVCALPSRLLVTMPTERPRSAAEIAARKPAPPAPIYEDVVFADLVLLVVAVAPVMSVGFHF